jgi:hypothetical protein
MISGDLVVGGALAAAWTLPIAGGLFLVLKLLGASGWMLTAPPLALLTANLLMEDRM